MTNSREKWIVLGMLWLVCALNYADRQAISSLFPLLEREFGFTKVQLGLIGSAFMWVYAASAPFAGYAGDRHSRKAMIIGGCFVWSLMVAVTGWCGRLWQFVAARALIGFGESVYFPAAASMLSDYHGPRTRSTARPLSRFTNRPFISGRSSEGGSVPYWRSATGGGGPSMDSEEPGSWLS